MGIFSESERLQSQNVSRMVYCNPFLPERIECERAILGDEFIASADVVWSADDAPDAVRPNLVKLQECVERLATAARQRLTDGVHAERGELPAYEDLIVYLLYYRNYAHFDRWVLALPKKPPAADLAAVYEKFEADFRFFLRTPESPLRPSYRPEHLFACLFQVRRAFFEIFTHIVGRSMPAARLRAAVWQSIFTHDLRRYQRSLYDRTGDWATLITGPSGTGKELVARAIALSRYVPFDPATKSFADFSSTFHPLNLSALSPTLIESELFGHRRGAFTGALEDRIGWLEACPPLGTVFLDEIGELDTAIQVKLLRVLQSRTFQRLGDTGPRHFRGKIIAATNRDLSKELSAGKFREDFYYRLCSDLILTPTLREQLAESPDELHHLVEFIARAVSGEESERLAKEVTDWIQTNLTPTGYPWPGNFRELEQCVRNILIRGTYRPLAPTPVDDADDLKDAIQSASISADELLRRYCTLVYQRTRSYEQTARKLDLDRRTVKAKVDVTS